jgi:hypothetical protein
VFGEFGDGVESQVDTAVLQVGADAAQVAQQVLDLRRDVSRCLGFNWLHQRLRAGAIVGTAAGGLGRCGQCQGRSDQQGQGD